MRTVFITPAGRPLKRWEVAFPKLVIQPSAQAYLGSSHGSVDILWLDTSAFGAAEAEQGIRTLVMSGTPVVALSATPSESEAFRMLSAGARGYCHAEAVPEQLTEVASVVTRGGFWMPPGLVQRLVSVATRTAAQTPQPEIAGFDQLTQREYDVARQVGQGANNKEIALALGVSERTVKAHLTAIFDKLGLRDRVQLALAVNRLPIH